MTTRNFDKLRREVAAHVAADTIVQGAYWDEATKSGCYIGCLARSNNPAVNEAEYGLPVMLQRIAESIFEALPADEAKTFFAALPDAVGRDGKDLTKVGWQFLAAELRLLPPQTTDNQAVIDPVVAGMDLLANGQDWPAARAAYDLAAATAAYAYADAAYHAASVATAAATAAARAANAAYTYAYTYAATNAAANAAAHAAHAHAHAYANATYARARLRQRDLLLQLISDAPKP